MKTRSPLTALAALMLVASLLGGCAVVTVAGAAVGVAGAVLSTGVSIVGAAVDVVIPDDDDEDD